MKCPRCAKPLEDGFEFCPFCGKRLAGTKPVQRRTRRRPKGTGSVYKIGGNRANPWVATTSDRQLVGTYATSSEAVAALDSYNAQRIPLERSRYTLANVYESFQQSPAWEKLSDKGREGLQAAWKRLEPLAARKATAVTVMDYQNILDTAMVTQRYKERTPAEIAAMKESERIRYMELIAQPQQPLGYDGKNRIKQLVSHLYNEMIRLGISQENLSDVLVLPVQKSGRKKRNFTQQEKDLLKTHDDDEVVKIILIYIGTGMRLNELLRLPKESVDLGRRILTGGSKTEAGRNRVVPILDNIYPYVEYFYSKSKRYLIEENGKPLRDDTFRRRRFYPKLEELGIAYQEEGKNTLTPHRARHTFVADSITGGMAPEALTKIAGYSRYDVAVDKYADDLSLEYLQAEMRKKA